MILWEKKAQTYNRHAGTPNDNERERQDETDFVGDIFLQIFVRQNNGERDFETYMRARVKALGAVTGMKQEGAVVLHLSKLVSKSLNLSR